MLTSNHGDISFTQFSLHTRLEFIYVLSKKLDVPIIEFFKGID